MTARYCGRCHACCVHLDLGPRPAHTPCAELDDAGRCRIYGDRPKQCSGFYCAWLLGLIPEDKRPDSCGVLVQIAKNALGGIGINVIECRPGALDAEAELMKKLQSWPCRLIEFRWLSGKEIMWSADQTWIDHLRANNPKLGVPDDAMTVTIEIMNREGGRYDRPAQVCTS